VAALRSVHAGLDVDGQVPDGELPEVLALVDRIADLLELPPQLVDLAQQAAVVVRAVPKRPGTIVGAVAGRRVTQATLPGAAAEAGGAPRRGALFPP
jgi:hypothetical protein